jgi:hypothetical protein
MKRRSKKPFKLSANTLSPDQPRFHVFLIDTGWNKPISEAVRAQIKLFCSHHLKDPIYVLTGEQSARILERRPEHIGLDPIVIVYDLYRPNAKTKRYHGLRLNLGRFKSPVQALFRLQQLVRFLAMHRATQDLSAAVGQELHKEGLANTFQIISELSHTSLELL